MDTALRLGPIPIEEIGVFLELAKPTVSRVAEERPPIPSRP